MPYVPGHEEDGFLKKLDITPADIEPKADRCTQVRINTRPSFSIPTILYLMKKAISPFSLLIIRPTNLNNEFMSDRVDANQLDLRLAHADQIQQPG
jgi:hypothetical protein